MIYIFCQYLDFIVLMKLQEIKMFLFFLVSYLFQPKLLSGDLLDLVASYFNLKEKEYFGLAFQDET